MLDRISLGGLDVLAAKNLLERGIVVAFTGKEGGSSTGAYSSLNLSYDVGDRTDDVTANRIAVARALGVPLERWVLGRQVHGTRVSTVSSLDPGRGARDFLSGIPRTDALVSCLAGPGVAVLTADCLPVVMVAPGRAGNAAVAVAHAGWRGVLGGTAARAMRALARYAACRADEILVFIGPHIRDCCMEVDGNLAGRFLEWFGEGVALPGSGGKYFIDLERACEKQLVAAGASGGKIFSAGTCTACGTGYFSFRRSGGSCGRQGGFAAILGDNWS